MTLELLAIVQSILLPLLVLQPSLASGELSSLQLGGGCTGMDGVGLKPLQLACGLDH